MTPVLIDVPLISSSYRNQSFTYSFLFYVLVGCLIVIMILLFLYYLYNCMNDKIVYIESFTSFP